MGLLSPSDIEALLRSHGVHASKALGQHFLADPNTARKIVRLAGISAGDPVLEIGPGVGSLTVALVEAGAEVVALERDRHVLPLLDEVLAGAAVTVVEGDALEADYGEILGPAPVAGGRAWRCVSNLPYNLATPIVVTLLEQAPQVASLLVMVQREVAERLAARPGERAAGAATIKVAYHGTARVEARVPPTVFVPRPNVESALLRIDRHPTPPVEVDDPDALFALVRAGFGQRRKTIGRSLRSVLGPGWSETVASAGLDPRRRAETLTLDDWAALADAWVRHPSTSTPGHDAAGPTR